MNQRRQRSPLPWWLRHLTPLGAVMWAGFLVLLLTFLVLRLLLTWR